MKQKIQNVGQFLRWTPWQVKLSMIVMGLGQLCYGQIVKGLFYLACFAILLTYFVTRGFGDLIGFFTLGTNEENLWLGIPGDNSLTMLILGLFAIFILIFTVVLYVTNVKDAREKLLYFKLRDVLVTQLAVLKAMIDYADEVGDTRGSSLNYDAKGSLRRGLEELFRFTELLGGGM